MIKLVVILIISTLCESARILIIMPTPSYSHQVTLQPVWKELALRGHDVVVLTTDPLRDPTIPNLKEIDWSFAHGLWKAGMTKISDEYNMFGSITTMVNVMSEILEKELLHPEVQALIKNETEHFDLLITEFIGGTMFAFKERFKCPFIGFFSMDIPGQVHEKIGNARHSVAYPDPVFAFPDDLNVFQRIMALAATAIFESLWYFFFGPRDTLLIKKYFGEDYPSVDDLTRSVDMVFINSNPVLYPIRPISPATVVISGGIHIKDPKPLPKDLQTYFNNSENGVIYFSLGSNVKSKDIPTKTKQIVVETLSELPYDILWKYEDDNFLDKPKNIKLVQWAPQQDILRHPKIRLFITQCGLQSLEEALFNHVPIICIPFVFDQHYNAQRVVDRGMGFTFDFNTITKDGFKGGILEAIKNPKYKNKMRELAGLVKDEPMTALQKAVWWTEYVIRHKGAQHLKAKTIPYYQFYYLDVIAVLLSVFIGVFLIVKKCIIAICRTKQKKE